MLMPVPVSILFDALTINFLLEHFYPVISAGVLCIISPLLFTFVILLGKA